MNNQIVQIDKATSIGCGKCANMCPLGILFINEDNIAEVSNAPQCDRLRGCMRVCPVGAIKIA